MPNPPADPGASFWDRAYRAGDHRRHWDPPEVPRELRAALASELLRPGQAALDVGCGAGAEAVALAVAGLSVIAVDRSAVALELAARRAAAAGVELDCRRGDAARLPVADNAVDVAIDRGCFHVISRRRRRLYAKEMARVLRPGGTLLLRGAAEDDEEAGLLGLGKREVQRLFAARGFTLLSFRPVVLRARAGDLEGAQATLRLAGPPPRLCTG